MFHLVFSREFLFHCNLLFSCGDRSQPLSLLYLYTRNVDDDGVIVDRGGLHSGGGDDDADDDDMGTLCRIKQ